MDDFIKAWPFLTVLLIQWNSEIMKRHALPFCKQSQPNCSVICSLVVISPLWNTFKCWSDSSETKSVYLWCKTVLHRSSKLFSWYIHIPFFFLIFFSFAGNLRWRCFVASSSEYLYSFYQHEALLNLESCDRPGRNCEILCRVSGVTCGFFFLLCSLNTVYLDFKSWTVWMSWALFNSQA